MSLTSTELISFLSNYLLTATCCFAGAFVREAYTSMKSKSKISFGKIMLDSILGGFVSCCAYRILTSHMDKSIELEIYLAISFAIGLCSNFILELLTNKNLFKFAAQGVVERFGGETGKAMVKAWKESDKEKEEKKEKTAKEKAEKKKQKESAKKEDTEKD